MIRIKFTAESSFYLENHIVSQGDVVDVPDAIAKRLLELKHAEKVEGIKDSIKEDKKKDK